MNIYRYRFNCVCPSDQTTVTYDLTITSPGKVLAEDIRTICDAGPSHQEDLADKLAALGGEQVIRAIHQGVEIETRRP
ncbi:hypothetical protein [Sinorhizobium sp. BJ1]|uniref:hypothetical protein n=1 Tax=Sinorhizobium sp. BJ1 TaxID=2035455 RepID=UPI000BE7C73D|nr:hypothetical protein [Sinorhizobium sp. BJ1]PDT79935.1 hypothetical protein CO676_30225 [Sinorhizobium sp. BJ1]